MKLLPILLTEVKIINKYLPRIQRKHIRSSHPQEQHTTNVRRKQILATGKSLVHKRDSHT
jgi:hypothetical protein